MKAKEQVTPEEQTNVVSNEPVVSSDMSKKPQRNKLFIAGVITLLFMAALFVLVVPLVRKDTKTVETTNKTVEISVKITDAGFVPSTMVIKKGTTVVWKNDSATPRKVGSNPFPDHSSLPGLYSNDVIVPGGTYSYTFNETGEWGYADYTTPTNSAKIIVQ